jgi:hypothetical protein
MYHQALTKARQPTVSFSKREASQCGGRGQESDVPAHSVICATTSYQIVDQPSRFMGSMQYAHKQHGLLCLSVALP